MKDYIVRAAAANAQIRAFAASTTELVEEARSRHNTSPVATAALGRLLTGGVMMGSMMKNATDVLTLQIQCQGPIGGLTVTADAQGNVKGYVNEPEVIAPAEKRQAGRGRSARTRNPQCDQGYGTERILQRTDDPADRGDRGRSDLLFCNIRTGSILGRIGSPDEQRQYRALCRRIYRTGDAVYRGTGIGEAGRKYREDPVCDINAGRRAHTGRNALPGVGGTGYGSDRYASGTVFLQLF